MFGDLVTRPTMDLFFLLSPSLSLSLSDIYREWLTGTGRTFGRPATTLRTRVPRHKCFVSKPAAGERPRP